MFAKCCTTSVCVYICIYYIHKYLTFPSRHVTDEVQGLAQGHTATVRIQTQIRFDSKACGLCTKLQFGKVPEERIEKRHEKFLATLGILLPRYLGPAFKIREVEPPSDSIAHNPQPVFATPCYSLNLSYIQIIV